MAAASPTPLPLYGNGKLSRQPSRLQHRHGSPSAILGQSQGFSSNAPQLQNIGIGDSDDSSDDEIPQPMNLNPLTRALLAAEQLESPKKQQRPSKIRISRNTSRSGTPLHDSITPAPSALRIKRVGLQGAPMRRVKRTPQGSQEDHPPSQDQENLVVSTVKQQDDEYRKIEVQAFAPKPEMQNYDSIRKTQVPGRILVQRDDSVMKPQPSERIPVHQEDSIMKPQRPQRISVHQEDSIMKPQRPERIPVHQEDSIMKPQRPERPTIQRNEQPIPLAPVSANTPHRPAPPPPPKMSVLEAATAQAGAATTKTRRRTHMKVNGKVYTQMGKIGRGGSSDVYRVMAENCKMFALKRVKLEDADESAVRGYKGEIELLRKLDKVDRVVQLYDWQVDEEKCCLSVLMEIGESDLARLLRMKLDPPAPSHSNEPAPPATLDLAFTRYYWAEMLHCVAAVHALDIVHSDLKPANFLLVQGQLKLIDFGIANAIDTDNTVNVHRDSHVGTPNYMSPESLQDSRPANTPADEVHVGKLMKLGKPSDVWSLGCILYQMVYRIPPFAHITSQIQRVMAIINPSHTIDFPSHGIGGVRVPPALRQTLKKCLQRDPAKRPTVQQLLSERDPFLYPDAGDDLRIPQELLGQIIMRVAERCRDERKGFPTEEEIRQYPASFYAKIRDLMEEV